MDSSKLKVVRVGLNEEQHNVLEAYQAAVKLESKPKPSKEDVIVLSLEKGGFKWLEKRTEAIRKRAAKKLLK